MSVAAKEIPSADSTGAPYIAGNFAPLKSEVTTFDLKVIGRVPEELTGRFLRIGPNPVGEPDMVWVVRHHWFAGTGMAHGLRLQGGKAALDISHDGRLPVCKACAASDRR